MAKLEQPLMAVLRRLAEAMQVMAGAVVVVVVDSLRLVAVALVDIPALVVMAITTALLLQQVLAAVAAAVVAHTLVGTMEVAAAVALAYMVKALVELRAIPAAQAIRVPAAHPVETAAMQLILQAQVAALEVMVVLAGLMAAALVTTLVTQIQLMAVHLVVQELFVSSGVLVELAVHHRSHQLTSALNF